MIVSDLLRDSARRYPSRVVTIHRNERLTYSELDKISDALSRRLVESGIKRRDRVAILLENSHEYVVSFFATLKAGAAVIPIDTQAVSRELLFYLEDCAAQLVLTDPNHAGFVEGVLANLSNPPPVMRIDQSSLQSDGSSTSLPIISCAAEEMASILYTSGTTGKPKGVMLSHANLVANTDSIVEYLHLEPDDKTMVVLPFSHSYGMSVLLTRVKAGGTLVIDNRFAYPNAILQSMDTEGVTGFDGVPSHYAILLRRSALRKMKLPKLKYATQAGGALAPAMIEEFLDIMPHVRFYVMYGQTEAAARLSYLEPNLLRVKLGSVGKAIPEVHLEVLNDSGQRVRPGETGEIVARGKNVMLGYWNAPEETELVLRDGALFTGDLARMDEEGFLYIVGRRKEMIKSGGNRISPLEIEAVVCQLAGVAECSAVGMPDDILGEAIKLLVVTDSSNIITEREIALFCKQNLAPYKVPKVVEIVPSLPKTASGKIKRVGLGTM